MSFVLFIEILKSLPLLIKTVAEIWSWLVRTSHGHPEMLLMEIHAITKQINENDTAESRQDAARRLSLLWAGMPNNKT